MRISVFSDLAFVFKRLWRHKGLVLSLATGLVVAAALATAVPLYSDGINYNLLNAALSKSAVENRHPPFHFIYHYVGSWHEPIDMEQYAPQDQFMQEQIAGVIGLPVVGITRAVSTDNLQLYPNGTTINRNERLDLVKLNFVSGVFDHLRLVEGDLPNPATEAGSVIEGLVSLKLANDLGLQVGDTYLVYKSDSGGGAPYQQPVRVTGIWVPKDAGEDYWFYPPESFEKKLLVPEGTFFGPLVQRLSKPVNEAVWRITFIGDSVHSEDVPGLLARIDQAQTRANALLAHTDLEQSPLQALRQYRRDALALTGLLAIFNAPVLALVFYFLGLVADMLVRRQRNEIAVLRSRGASRRWVVSLYLAEWLLLSGAALVAGTWLGIWIARLLGYTQSFLDFSRPALLTIRLTPSVWGVGLLTVGVALLFSLLPAWSASRFTIVSYKQDRARSRQRPFWQRIYLDVIFLLPALYGLYTLRQQGALNLFGRTLTSGTLYTNPLAFLLPTFFISGLSLLVLRLLPLAMSGLARFFTLLPGLVPLLVLRQLSRSMSSYLGPLLLMMVTISLAGFTASMAHTFDRHLVDSVYYETGADLNLAEQGEYSAEPSNLSGSQGSGSAQTEPSVWNFLPVSDHLALPGVQAAARVGSYEAELQAAGRYAAGQLLGLDRVEFPPVAFFREDFANEPLMALMNRLASDPAALLVDRGTWERYHLNTGDQVVVQMKSGKTYTIPFKIAGVLEYFPTLYPGDSPFFVANLDYIFTACEGLQPYNVWLKTQPGTDTAALVRRINQLGVAVIRIQDARQILEDNFGTANRQGVLGLLSVGFLAALFITVIGFLLNAIFSFRERFIQLGVLRAVGLSIQQMGAFLGLEQLVLILIGLAAGTGIAVLTAYAFIPYMPIQIGDHPGIPPFVVEIAWGDILHTYAIFAVMLLVGVGVTLWSLAAMKIFQAVKLGENV